MFTLSLAGMMVKTAALPHNIETFIAQGQILDARNGLASVALGWGADWILWLDADQIFPHDTLIRLLSHGLDIVGSNYPRRRPVGTPTATKDGRPLYTDECKAKAGLVDEVDSLGLGVCLTRSSVFQAIERPWFNFEVKPDRSGHISEDVSFFRAARRAGIVAHVDHSLSWEVGHIHEQTLTNLMMRRDYADSVHPSAGAK